MTWKWKKSDKRNVLYDRESYDKFVQAFIWEWVDVMKREIPLHIFYPIGCLEFETMTEYNGFLVEV